ncbi:MAG TPA: diaminopimelate decarboxylase [Acidimicrobiales bacterium]|nr:diaminopimelate decarboxylase [Acidimicrobiales bacterium]
MPDTAALTASGGLAVGGVDVVALAEEFGTPLFVYDEAALRARCREVLSAFGPGSAYATKAFLCRAMAELAIGEGLQLDVSTDGELGVALAAGAEPDDIVFHGNNKSEGELATAVGLGVGRLAVDSFDEVDRLTRLLEARRHGAHQKILVRVNPGIEAHTHEFVSTGQEDSKFGFSVASGAARVAINALRGLPGGEVVGVHAHIGSQIQRLTSFERLAEILAPIVLANGLAELCVGGGLGVAYLSGESAPTISEWGATVRASCARAGLGPAVRITAEPGRSVVATAAMTCYRVGTIKELPGIRNYVAVDGGMSDNPRPVLYGSGYEAFLPRAVGAERPYAARIVGKHCESGDVVVAEARLPRDVAVGDVLVTPVTGAYGFSMASNYNRVGRPPVVFVHEGRARLVVRRETVEDLLRLES